MDLLNDWLIQPSIERYFLDWGAMVFGIIAMWRLSGKHRDGFMWGLVSNVFWIGFNWLVPSVAGVLFNVIWIAINIRGLVMWAKAERGGTEPHT